MNKRIIIGKEGNQPFLIQDPNVSRKHAELIITENGQMHLTDTCSTNGTYIYNGSEFVRINSNRPYQVTANSMIQLGPNTRFHIRRLIAGIELEKPKKPDSPKPIDISHLRKISDTYTSEKMQIEQKTGMVNSLRSCTILVSLLATGAGTIFSGGVLGQEKDLKIYSILISIGIGATLMLTLFLLINNFNKKLIIRKNKCEHSYAVNYCCPSCHTSFRGKIYENILSERKCPKCKTPYYEESKN